VWHVAIATNEVHVVDGTFLLCPIKNRNKEGNNLQKLITTTNIVIVTKKFMNNKKQQWGVDM
jgi:hypothetical protein